MSEKHWTDKGSGYLHQWVASDAAAQLGIDGEGGIELDDIIIEARSQNKKIAVILYDSDTPIPGAVFAEAWKHTGAPADFFELAEVQKED